MANFTVTNLLDSGAGSLRQAILDANGAAGADTITFNVSGTITLASQLGITDDVTITGDTNGDRKADVTISGNNANRIFDITGNNADVVLNSLTLTNGGTSALLGGAIKVGFGANETLTINDTTIQNSASINGGAIYSNNGAGITINNSLISGNTANSNTTSGGGIYIKTGSLSLTNTTVTGNIANANGGGIGAVGGATVNITNSTITNNKADFNGAVTTAGGGIAQSGATVNLVNTLVAGNTSGTTLAANDVSGTIATANHSVFGTAPTVTTNTLSLLNQTAGAINLGALGNNGGTTQTFNINAGSVLINAGTNTGVPAMDANGNVRISGGRADVGATEFGLEVNTLSDVVDANDGLLSLREAVAIANANADANVITFKAGLAGTITLTGGELALTQDVTIDGDNTGDNKADITISGGYTTRIFNQTGATTDVDLLSLRLAGGNAGAGAGGYGGAILANSSGTLDIFDTTITGNTARQGGGIYADSTTVSLRDSLLSANTSSIDLIAFGAGGIYIANDTLNLANTTVTGNSTTGNGGGIEANTATVNITNSTITNNQADTNGTNATLGGGLSLKGTTTATITNSVIADNTSGGATEKDVAGTVTTATNSVFGTTTTITTSTLVQQNVADIGLGALQNNGGTTDTRNANVGSVLINAGSNAGAAGIATDANGVQRIGGGTVDIGATEFRTILTVTNLNDSGAGSLRDAVTAANANADANDIVFQAGLNGTINLISSGLFLSKNVTINGDTNGDGDANITLDVTDSSTPLITISGGTTAALTSLTFSGVTNSSYGGGGVIQNNGNLTLNYSVISGNALLGSFGSSGQGFLASPIVNTGTMVANQTVFANNTATGGTGYNTFGASRNGDPGGNASSSIINTGTITLRGLALIGGTVTGGTGGIGDNGDPSNNPNQEPRDGFAGGAGGIAAIGILNSGTVSGSYGLGAAGTATGGNGGQGGDGVYGGMQGPTGATGLADLNNLNIGGTSTLSLVQTGTAGADTQNFYGNGTTTFGLGGADDLRNNSTFGRLYGGTGNDTLTSSGGSTLRGGLGNDVLRNSYVNPNYGAGTWDGGQGIDTFDGSISTSTQYGLILNLSRRTDNNFNGTITSIENIIGTNNAALRDFLTGDAGVNNIQGLAGNDVIEGKGGADVLNGGANTAAGDTLSYESSVAGISINLLTSLAQGGDAQGDSFTGFENVTGSDFGDQLVGDNGANVLTGGAGNDLFVGGLGADTMIGGADLDVVDYSGFGSGVSVNLTTGTGPGGDVISEIENIIGSAFGDVLDGNNGANTMRGGAGNDFMVAGNGADLLIGGTDNDEVSYATATTGVFVNLTTGTGANGGVLQEIENIRGSNFGDVLQGDNGANTIRGLDGNDFIIAGNGADLLIGGNDNDTVSYETATAGIFANLTTGIGANGGVLQEIENLTGSNFGDVLIGSSGGNTLKGGAGNDFIVGNSGSDALFGGTDNDTFRFETTTFGNDVITDFQDNGDKLSFAAAVATNFNQFTILNNNTTNVTVQIAGQSIVVQGVANISLTVADFLFV